MAISNDATSGPALFGQVNTDRPASRINWVLLTGLIAIGSVGLVVATTLSAALDAPGLPVSALVQPASSLAPVASASSVVYDANALPEALPATF